MLTEVRKPRPGNCLMLHGKYAVFIGEEQDNARVKLQDEESSTLAEISQLKPVYINRQIILQCGFRQEGNVYRDSHFEITIGGKDKSYVITGHRLKRPFITYLLSQLHVLQNIYFNDTGAELIFPVP